MRAVTYSRTHRHRQVRRLIPREEGRTCLFACLSPCSSSSLSLSSFLLISLFSCLAASPRLFSSAASRLIRRHFGSQHRAVLTALQAQPRAQFDYLRCLIEEEDKSSKGTDFSSFTSSSSSSAVISDFSLTTDTPLSIGNRDKEPAASTLDPGEKEERVLEGWLTRSTLPLIDDSNISKYRSTRRRGKTSSPF